MSQKEPDWYDLNIEEPIRDLVRYLRDNGINTECSCGHEGYIQCQYLPDGQLFDIHKLLFNWLSNHKRRIEFEVRITHKVIEGYTKSSMDVYLRDIPDDRVILKEAINRHGRLALYHDSRKNALERQLEMLVDKNPPDYPEESRCLSTDV